MQKDPLRFRPVPPQMPVTEGLAALPDTRLWYWDTGGDGDVIILVHPASGSSLIWGYQQPAFSQAGYRVVGYSRRGFYKSDPLSPENPGIASEDLRNLADFLGIDKFHAVGSAAGGTIAADFACSYPERLASLTVSSNPCGLRQGGIAETYVAIRPEGWEDFPRWFWEVGPSYRAINPEGVKLWIELEHHSQAYGRSQSSTRQISEADLECLAVPTLLMTGSADLATPPSLLRMVARHIPDCTVKIVAESGHSLYWERPDAFNKSVLDFIGRHAQKAE